MRVSVIPNTEPKGKRNGRTTHSGANHQLPHSVLSPHSPHVVERPERNPVMHEQDRELKSLEHHKRDLPYAVHGYIVALGRVASARPDNGRPSRSTSDRQRLDYAIRDYHGRCAWTNRNCVRSGTVLDARLDVRDGGRYEITFRDCEDSRHTSSGVYLFRVHTLSVPSASSGQITC